MNYPEELHCMEQLQQLRVGNMLKNIPLASKKDNVKCPPGNGIKTYEIRSFNRKENTWKLALIDGVNGMFVWPDDFECFTVSSATLLSQNKWWII